MTMQETIAAYDGRICQLTSSSLFLVLMTASPKLSLVFLTGTSITYNTINPYCGYVHSSMNNTTHAGMNNVTHESVKHASMNNVSVILVNKNIIKKASLLSNVAAGLQYCNMGKVLLLVRKAHFSNKTYLDETPYKTSC